MKKRVLLIMLVLTAAKVMSQQTLGEFTEAVVDAVTHVGNVLASHFPRSPDDRNELPNQIARD